jgi:hypothetical protein
VRAVRHLPETLLEHQTTTSAFPFASSRLRVRPTKRKPRSSQRQSADSRLQRADLGLESPSYLHSRSFVVHRHPCVSFASSRLRVRPTARKPRSSQRQSAGSQWQRADLGLESPSYVHSRSFVVHRHPCVSFASSREAHGLQAPLPAAAVRRQPVAEGRSRAGKPELVRVREILGGGKNLGNVKKAPRR